jgi:hypothetical protein
MTGLSQEKIIVLAVLRGCCRFRLFTVNIEDVTILQGEDEKSVSDDRKGMGFV